MIENKKGFYVSLVFLAIPFILLILNVVSDNSINIIFASLAFLMLITLVFSLNKFRIPVFFIGIIWLVYLSAKHFSFVTGLSTEGTFYNNLLWISLILTGILFTFILFQSSNASKLFKRNEKIPGLKEEKNLKKAEGQVRKSLESSKAKEAGWVALCNEELDLLYKLFGALESEERILSHLTAELSELETSKTDEYYSRARFKRIFEKIKEFKLSMNTIELLKKRMVYSKLFKGAL